jgi:hypothetical protein
LCIESRGHGARAEKARILLRILDLDIETFQDLEDCTDNEKQNEFAEQH